MSIEIEKLVNEKVILETRFVQGYLYWDNCGKIWKSLCEKWPEFEIKTVSTQNATFSIKGEAFDIMFSDKDIRITQEYPANLEQFIEIADISIPLISELLGIKTFSRVGNRFMYIYPTENSEEAERMFSKFGILNVPKEKMNLFGSDIKEPSVRFNIEEEDVGFRFNIAVVSRKMEINLPKIVEVDLSKFSKTGILIDVDYYTKKDADLSVLDFGEIICSVEKRIRTKISDFLS